VSLCAGVTCPGGACNPETGACVDACQGVQCEAGDVCIDGLCVGDADCYETGCPDGELCRDGGCVEDPCLDIECGAESFCREGACVFSCAEIACGYGEACVDGECRNIACGGIVCGDGLSCVDGVCEDDVCDDDACGAGRLCLEGECADDPCGGIRCPANQRCTVVLGAAQCVADWRRPVDEGMGGAPGEPEVDPEPQGGELGGEGGAIDEPVFSECEGDAPGPECADGAGGNPAELPEDLPPDDPEAAVPGSCACDATDESPTPLSALLLLGLGLMRRRRRSTSP